MALSRPSRSSSTTKAGVHAAGGVASTGSSSGATSSRTTGASAVVGSGNGTTSPPARAGREGRRVGPLARGRCRGEQVLGRATILQPPPLRHHHGVGVAATQATVVHAGSGAAGHVGLQPGHRPGRIEAVGHDRRFRARRTLALLGHDRTLIGRRLPGRDTAGTAGTAPGLGAPHRLPEGDGRAVHRREHGGRRRQHHPGGHGPERAGLDPPRPAGGEVERASHAGGGRGRAPTASTRSSGTGRRRTARGRAPRAPAPASRFRAAATGRVRRGRPRRASGPGSAPATSTAARPARPHQRPCRSCCSTPPRPGTSRPPTWRRTPTVAR